MPGLIAAIGVLIILGAVMAAAKLCGGRLPPEGSRKAVHIVMGCTALAFPWLFADRFTVVCLGLAAITMLLFTRKNKFLRDGIGSALFGVQRQTLGDIYFVISIVVVFTLHESVYEYLIPIAVLTFADSAAALVGTSYGRNNMAQHADEDVKNSEGSVMFFLVAFICALVPLQLMSEVGRAEVLAVSFLIGFLAALVEAVSRHGNDNLLLPLLTYSFLRYNTAQPVGMILANFGIMLVLSVVIIIVYKITNITRLSMAYSLLVAYIVIIQGGLAWLVPPLMIFVTFGVLPMMKSAERQMTQTYKAIECNTVVGVVCLWLSVLFPAHRETLYIAFSLSFAIHLAVNTFSRLVNFNGVNAEISVIYGLMKSFIFVALPVWGISGMKWPVLALYVVFITISMFLVMPLNKKYDYKNMDFDAARLNALRMNRICLAGSLTAVFTVILMIAGGFYDISG